MELRILRQQEDKANDLFQSDDCQTLLRMYDEFYPAIGYNPPWVAYLVLSDNSVVGSCSFVGQPKDGSVEIAYWTFNEFEGKGVASFACNQLVEIAYNNDPDVKITAKTAPEHNSSTRILEKNNFKFSHVVQDHEIGDAWLWTHQKNA